MGEECVDRGVVPRQMLCSVTVGPCVPPLILGIRWCRLSPPGGISLPQSGQAASSVILKRCRPPCGEQVPLAAQRLPA